MLVILTLAVLMLMIDSANGNVYFSPTFKLKYGIIFITSAQLSDSAT